MKRTIVAIGTLCLLSAGAQAQDLRIGYINTTTGGGAVLGKHLENGWKLGLEHHGWQKDGDKLGGVPTRIFYADDQMKTDIALREAEKMLSGHKVHIVAGVIWSNVLMALTRPVFNAKAILFSTNAGPAPLAGEACHPLFVSSAFQNDQASEAMGVLATREGIKTVFGLAPNYQAGKDYLAGFQRTFKGKMVDRALFRVGESDFQAEFSKVRAAKPDAVYVFAPGAMGISFMKQWSASGLGKEIKLRSVYTVDETNIAAIGADALGDVQTGHWTADIDNERNKRFIKGYIAKFGHDPSAYAAANYDAVTLIAEGMKRVNGDTSDMAAMARAMRKGGLPSVRGDLKFNVNGFLIKPYYRRELVRAENGKLEFRGREIVFERPDSYWEKCPADRRI